MKARKTLSGLLVVLLSVMPIIAVRAWTPPSLPPYTWIYASDYKVYTSADLTGQEFNVTINIYNVTNMGALSFKLGYNTTLLDAKWMWAGPVMYDKMSDFVPSPWNATIGIVDAAGYVVFGCVVKDYRYPYSGDCLAMTVKFEITLAPPQLIAPPPNRTVSCALDLYEVVFKGVDPGTGGVVTFDFGIDDGLYEYTRPQIIPGKPVAEFTWSPAIPYESDTVTLDASPSTPNGGTITGWSWTVTGDATLTGADNTKVTTMHCDGAGTAIVTLVVYDSEGETSLPTQHTITQLAVVGAIIDLYTSENRFCGQTTPNIGTGPDQNCDALSPDVNVTLFAKVTWGGAPVNHVLVAFEVRWMEYIDWREVSPTPVTKDECVLYRTAETDKDGIAKIWFRVPTPCEGQMFGKWLAIADCKVQEQKIEDRMNFDVGYLINILYGGVTLDKTTYVRDNPPSHPGDYITVYIETKNIAWVAKSVTLVVTFYDDCDVPIGQKIAPVTLSGGVYCDPKEHTTILYDAIEVPQWAYVGVGKVYVSAFTALPKDCGVPYCTEEGTTFVIEYQP